jgi:hypothetical protein
MLRALRRRLFVQAGTVTQAARCRRREGMYSPCKYKDGKFSTQKVQIKSKRNI